MPSRSYYNPLDFKHIDAILRDAHGEPYLRSRWISEESLICPLFDENSLSYALGIDKSILKRIARRSYKHYRVFNIKHKNGKVREICAPRTYLKVIQWWILDNILLNNHWPHYVQGFVTGRSAFSNAIAHKGAKHVVNVDVKDFFPSIPESSVKLIFKDMGYEENTCSLLARLCTLNGKLPQGAPTSPALANYFCRELDKDLSILADSLNCKYTRYADDITFSSVDFIDIDILTYIDEILKKYNLLANIRKTRVSGTGHRLEITGFVINDKIQLPREWRKRIRAIFHNASKNPSAFSERKKELNGYLSVCKVFERDTQNIKKYQDVLEMIPE